MNSFNERNEYLLKLYKSLNLNLTTSAASLLSIKRHNLKSFIGFVVYTLYTQHKTLENVDLCYTLKNNKKTQKMLRILGKIKSEIVNKEYTSVIKSDNILK
jgi:uncharacterized lipoprotein YehR (DUF1307 family)